MRKHLLTKSLNLVLLLFIVPYTMNANTWLRLSNSVRSVKISPDGKYLAFIEDKKSLSVMDLKSKKIYAAAPSAGVDSSFFWLPYGKRLLFKQRRKNLKGEVYTKVSAYDCYLKKTVHIANHKESSGYLNFNPKNNSFYALDHKGKLLARKLLFGKNKLAEWTRFNRQQEGFWIASPNGMIWATEGGFAVKKVTDNYLHIESFSVSPDGNSVAWNDSDGEVFISTKGQKPLRLGVGRDPTWHPTKGLLLYSGARLAGKKIVGYDLRVSNMQGSGKWLTHTPHSDERWPSWYPGSKKVIYTKMRTTDLFILNVKKKL